MSFAISCFVAGFLILGMPAPVCSAETEKCPEMVEILGMTIPSESCQPSVTMPCSNVWSFVECNCHYDCETRHLSKVVLRALCEETTDISVQTRKLVSWVAEGMLPNSSCATVQTDYGESRVENSWGEIAQLEALNGCFVLTVTNIAVARRLSQAGRPEVEFPRHFMEMELCAIPPEDCVVGMETIYAGVGKGRYLFYRYELRRKETFCASPVEIKVNLSLKSRKILAVHLRMQFAEHERENVISEFLAFARRKHGCGELRLRREPETGLVYAGTDGICDNGIKISFKTERTMDQSKSVLIAEFRLPDPSYYELLAEGRQP